MRPIKVITTSDRKERIMEAKEYKHFEVPRLWYSLPSLLMSNVTSLANKMDELIASVRTHCPDIVAITETWQIVPEVCNIQDYQLFHHLRTERRGGGVALYCRSDLPPSHLNIVPPPEWRHYGCGSRPPVTPAPQPPSLCAWYTTPLAPTLHSYLRTILLKLLTT